MPSTEPRQSFWQVARRPRMIVLLLIFLIAAAGCARLGIWQIDRAQEKGDLAEKQAAIEAAEEGPEGLGVLLTPQTSFSGNLVGRTAWVEGTYEDDQYLVPDRVLNGSEGFLVLTPLRVSDDGTDGESWADLSGPPVLAVVRGWVPAGTDPDDPALAVPTGVVRLTGYLQAGEAAADDRDIPEGQIGAVSTAELANFWGSPIYSGYLVEKTSDPAAISPDDGGPAPLPRPTIAGGEGLDLRNAFYALQWFVFGGFAVLLWIRLVRDEVAGKRGLAQIPLDDELR